MSQPTRQTSPFAGPTPTTPLPETVLTALAAARARVTNPGTDLTEAALTGSAVTIWAYSIRELSSWYEQFRPASTAGVCSRNGGGLEWVLSVRGALPDGLELVVRAETVEQEVLPDVPVVRSVCPDVLRLQAVRAREIAAHRVPGVAA